MNTIGICLLIFGIFVTKSHCNAPDITDLPKTINIIESQTGSTTTELTTISVTDTDTFTCSISSITPTVTGFSLVDVSGTFKFYLNTNPGFDDAVQDTYTVSIECVDSAGNTSSGDIIVKITANSPPMFTGLPASKSILESAASGTSVHTVAVTDPESDSISCTISSSPASGNFQIDHATNLISLAPGHSLTAPQYIISISCTDGRGTSTETVTVDVLQNSPPVFTGLPTTAATTEDAALGSTVYTVVVTDPEPDSFVCSFTESPNDNAFDLQQSAPNYDIVLRGAPSSSSSPYTITITCADNWGSSSTTLMVTVAANLPPVITGIPTTLNIREDDSGGSSIHTVTVTDTDTFSCGIAVTPPVTGFQLSQATATTYDIDLLPTHALDYDTASSHVISVTCTDATGSSSGSLTVNVEQNQPPDITSLPASGSYSSGTTAKTKIHDLGVTDPEGDFIVCGASSSPNGPFSLDLNGGAYELYVNANPTFSASSYTISIQCVDAYGSSTSTFTLTVTPNSAPVITGMPTTVSVTETETTERDLYTISVTDAESDPVTCSLVAVPDGPFTIDQNPATPSHKVVLDANAIDRLDAQTNPFHTITVTCTDTAGGSTTGSLTVTVDQNFPPAVDALPDHYQLSENTITEIEIWNLGYTDPENDLVTCTIITVPTGGPFDLRESGTPNDYRLWCTSNPALDFSTVQTWEVVFTCTDHHSGRTGRSSNGSLFVDILENRPPVFTSTNTLTRNAQSTPINTIIHTCVTTDDDVGDKVNYTMTVIPETGSFAIDPATCEVHAVRDLVYELETFFTARIVANDGKAMTTQDLGITLTNVNTPPEITSIGLNQLVSVYFDETTPTDTLLYSPVVYDPDAGQTQTITYSVFPAGEVDMFDVSPTAVRLKNGKTFDYEDINLYKLTMYVTDTYTTTGPYYLDVHVNNVPEVCGFDKVVYEASTWEAGQGGGRMDIGFTISDEDDPDYHTFSLIDNPHSQYYQIDQFTGQISFKTNYDVDRCGFGHPTNATLLCKCTDKFGETGTATVSVYVSDSNDNKPICQNSEVFVNQYHTPGNLLGSVNATDCDSGQNANLVYTGASSTGSGYYTLTATGNIYLTNPIDFDYGTDHTFLVTVRDQGTPVLSSTCHVTVIYRYVTTTTTTTVTPNVPTDWWDKPENVAMVAILALLTLFLLALLAYLCCRNGLPCNSPFDICKKDCCKPRQPVKKVVTPKNPKKDPFKFFDHNDLNKQREMFSTKDQVSDVPIPMKM